MALSSEDKKKYMQLAFAEAKKSSEARRSANRCDID